MKMLYYASGGVHPPFRRQIEAAGLQETRDFLDDWDLYVPDYGVSYEEEMRDLLPARIDQWIGGLPRSYWIANKGNLWTALVLSSSREAAARIMPETWRAGHPGQIEKLVAKWSPEMRLISKNPSLQRRKGLRLCETPQDAAAAAEEGFQLVQRLIRDQLLIVGHRFHIRLYLLVMIAEQRISAWIHQIGKVIYTEKPIAASSGLSAWITRSRGSDKLPPSMPFTWAALRDAQPLLDQDRVDVVLQTMLRATFPYLRKAWKLSCNRAFQLFGVDILFGADGQPWLLECNKGPDMAARCKRDATLKRTVLRDSLTLMDIPGLPAWPAGFRCLVDEPIVASAEE